MNRIESAMKTCMSAHIGQLDRDGLPHAAHSFRVADKQTTEIRKIVAYLHDVIEDCDEVWRDRIRLGYGENIYKKVLLLSREKDTSFIGGSYRTYIRLVALDKDCIYVKLADIEDNMSLTRTDAKALKNAPMYGWAYNHLTNALEDGNIGT